MKIFSQKIVLGFIFASFSLNSYQTQIVSGAPNLLYWDDSTEALKKKVIELESRLKKLEELVQSLRGKTGATTPQAGQATPSKINSTDIVFTVDSFSKIPDDLKLLAEADELKIQDSIDQKEIKRLEEQFRKLLDAMKELEERDRWREMTDVEYRRIMQENTNQRSDISAKISVIKEEMTKRKNLEKSKRRDAIGKGQRIEGHSDSRKFVIRTKLDCSKIVAVGAHLKALDPKSISSANGVEEYSASRVELAPQQK